MEAFIFEAELSSEKGDDSHFSAMPLRHYPECSPVYIALYVAESVEAGTQAAVLNISGLEWRVNCRYFNVLN